MSGLRILLTIGELSREGAIARTACDAIDRLL